LKEKTRFGGFFFACIFLTTPASAGFFSPAFYPAQARDQFLKQRGVRCLAVLR
jgi:hypothetical protein